MYCTEHVFFLWLYPCQDRGLISLAVIAYLMGRQRALRKTQRLFFGFIAVYLDKVTFFCPLIGIISIASSCKNAIDDARTWEKMHTYSDSDVLTYLIGCYKGLNPDLSMFFGYRLTPLSHLGTA